MRFPADRNGALSRDGILLEGRRGQRLGVDIGDEEQGVKQDQGWFHGVEIVRWVAARDKLNKKGGLQQG